MKLRFALISTILLFLTACSAQVVETDFIIPWDYERGTPISDFEGLRMEITDASPARANISIINDSNDAISLVWSRWLLAHRGGSWYHMSYEDVFFTGPYWPIQAGELLELPIHWVSFYGFLPAGSYRFVREFNASGTLVLIYADFSIDNSWSDYIADIQAERDGLAAEAFARFEGVEIEILNADSRDFAFRITNNNPHYDYRIFRVFAEIYVADSYGEYDFQYRSTLHSWDRNIGLPERLYRADSSIATAPLFFVPRDSEPQGIRLNVELRLLVEDDYFDHSDWINIPHYAPSWTHAITKEFYTD